MANQDLEPKKSALNPLAAPFEPNSGWDVEVNEAKPAQQLNAPFVKSKPFTGFHPFKRLPSELRLKIWKLNMLGARIIRLRYSKRIYQVGISDQIYRGNMDWDLEREDVFNLTKFTNLDMAAIVFDAGKKMVVPVKLVQLTWGECPVHTVAGRSKPDYDGDEVLHSCNLCYCPFIQEATLQLSIDHIYFEQLRLGLGVMFSEFKKRKLLDWKDPKTKSMVMTEKDRNVKKGSRVNVTRDGKRRVCMDPLRRPSGCF